MYKLFVAVANIGNKLISFFVLMMKELVGGGSGVYHFLKTISITSGYVCISFSSCISHYFIFFYIFVYFINHFHRIKPLLKVASLNGSIDEDRLAVIFNSRYDKRFLTLRLECVYIPVLS